MRSSTTLPQHTPTCMASSPETQPIHRLPSSLNRSCRRLLYLAKEPATGTIWTCQDRGCILAQYVAFCAMNTHRSLEPGFCQILLLAAARAHLVLASGFDSGGNHCYLMHKVARLRQECTHSRRSSAFCTLQCLQVASTRSVRSPLPSTARATAARARCPVRNKVIEARCRSIIRT